MSDIDDLQPDWEELSVEDELPVAASDRAIERLFEGGRLRVIQDRNDFFLPHVVDFIKGRKWGNLQPEYQRRLRWDNKKKSKLIESFLMNVPIPSVFLYEHKIGAFEVMDGQQRLSTVVEFLGDDFSLSGLEIWPALNDRKFSQLPPLLKRGLERAKLSAVTLISDPGDQVDSIDLRAQVFDRLNRGGERLNPQELRNSLYSGSMNQLSIDLSREPDFASAWEIPNHAQNTNADGSTKKELRENNLFKRMTDVEIVLRFFAFKDPAKIAGSVRGMLDRVLKENRTLTVERSEELQTEFKNALRLARGIFGVSAFRLPSANDGLGTLSRPVYDAQMVALHLLRDREAEIMARQEAVSTAVDALARPEAPSYELMVGRGNTAETIRQRIELVKETVENQL